MTSILVTGANGFVGNALCELGVERGFSLKGATRYPCRLADGIENVVVGELGDSTDWKQALCGVDVVIHLAARVHVMRDDSQDPLDEFRKISGQVLWQLPGVKETRSYPVMEVIKESQQIHLKMPGKVK